MVKKAYAPVWKFKWPRSVSRRQYCSRVPLTLTYLYLWKQSVNSNFKICPIGAFMQIWIPAKAPATKVVWLESRILITYNHGQIGARVPLEVPEEPQSPHTDRHSQIKVYEVYDTRLFFSSENCSVPWISFFLVWIWITLNSGYLS